MDLRERPGASFVRHPWETARSHFFGALLERMAGDPGPGRILDVGAGDAWLACQLSERCPGARIACWDASYTPDLLAEISPALPERVSVHRVRPDGRFDLVLLLDVLEHVEDDRAFLASLLEESLAPGGRVLLSVPAWPCLYGRQDRTLGHLRRYTRSRCRELLRAAGLRRLAGGGLFYSLVPARWASVRLDRLRGLSGPLADFELSWSHGARSARWVHRLLLLDGALARAAARLRLDLPGLSCWALCERSG
jgi:SAM-dependent methyltransferase